MNAAQQLFEVGQSVWYDNIQRKLLKDGTLAGMIERGEIRGVTSNPTIFMNAITKSNDYDETLIPMAKAGCSAVEMYYQAAVEDIQATADLFLPLYHETKGGDGYVSLEVSPYLAHETAATAAEARQLWQRVNRPNLMIKIPATLEGLPAFTEVIADGINVNVTLIFSRERYAMVMDAYMAGLERRAAQGLPVDRVASVASFFVSRLDANIDPRLQAMAETQGKVATSVLGKAAVANARLAFADFLKVTAGARWQKLAQLGAHAQRPLWASTGTKNPAYSDVLYIEELIGPNTVNTVPPATLGAFLDHGKVKPGSLGEAADAQVVMDTLASLGIDLRAVTDQLELEGVKAFSEAFDALLAAVEKRRVEALG